MTEQERKDALTRLTTAHLGDGCRKVGVPVRCGPVGLRAAVPGMRCAGRVLPVRHAGTIDIFFEALDQARPGDVLVIDNEARMDEACIGDLVALEVQNAELAGIVIWGLHRDTAELARIGLPVFSLGTLPVGPTREDPRDPDALASATVGEWTVSAGDWAICDADGLLFLPAADLDDIIAAADRIAATERGRAEAMRTGSTFRDQIRFADFRTARAADPRYGFRDYMKALSKPG